MIDKIKELRQWLDEDKTICKADKDYICNFIKENYISKEKIERVKKSIIKDEILDSCAFGFDFDKKEFIKWINKKLSILEEE
jgi:hypothetical protein